MVTEERPFTNQRRMCFNVMYRVVEMSRSIRHPRDSYSICSRVRLSAGSCNRKLPPRLNGCWIQFGIRSQQINYDEMLQNAEHSSRALTHSEIAFGRIPKIEAMGQERSDAV